MEYTLHCDGSYDLHFDGGSIRGAYPSVDGRALRPTRVHEAGNAITYQLPGGWFSLRFAREGGRIRIDAAFSGLDGAHDVSPIGGAAFDRMDKVFRQGFGMGGPSGLIDLEKDWRGHEGILSHGLIAVHSGQWLMLRALDHTQYKNQYELEWVKGSAGAAGKWSFSAGFVLEGQRSGEVLLPPVYVSAGDSLNEGLSACAAEIAGAMGARQTARPEFHWCSWYYLYHTLDQATLEAYAAGFARHKEDAPFRYLQIDAGYFPSQGDWLETNARFPGGMERAAQTIRQAGYEAGIWVGPFMVGAESRLFKEHPDWVLRGVDGKKIAPWIRYNEPKEWGYRDCEYYVLDTSHPDALEYLTQVFQTLRQWGYTLFKTDFLLWSIVDSSEVVRHTPGKTSIEYFREAMTAIRKGIGEDTAWLGCIAPFLPSIGFVDMMRIGGDVGAQWEEHGFGPTNMIRETIADQYFNHVYWTNDPDATMLRDFDIHLKPHEMEALALLQALSGGAVTTSDPIHLIGEDRKALLGMIRPEGLAAPRYPYWEDAREDIVIAHDLPQGKLVFWMNPTHREMVKPCDWGHLLGDGKWILTQWKGEARTAGEMPYVSIPAHSARLYFASREPLAKMPENLWTW